jgi:ribosome-binding protein aMBF1 (putative translation factor)
MENVLFSGQAELIDEARERLGLTSDYALAARLGWRQSTLTDYRKQRRCMATAQVLHFHEVTKIDLHRILVAVVADQQTKEKTTNGRPVSGPNELFQRTSVHP